MDTRLFLPEGAQLHGRFTISRVLNVTDGVVDYLVTDGEQGGTCVCREYLPQQSAHQFHICGLFFFTQTGFFKWDLEPPSEIVHHTELQIPKNISVFAEGSVKQVSVYGFAGRDVIVPVVNRGLDRRVVGLTAPVPVNGILEQHHPAAFKKDLVDVSEIFRISDARCERVLLRYIGADKDR